MVKTLSVVCIVFPLLFISFARAEVSDATNLDQGWRLWLDPKAAWQDDTLYLPEDVNLTNLPVNPPTGGWAVLNDQAGIGVSLPATVEEFYFNKAPARTTSFDQAIGDRRGRRILSGRVVVVSAVHATGPATR